MARSRRLAAIAPEGENVVMLVDLGIAAAAASLLVTLLVLEKRRRTWATLAAKTALSAAFVSAAVYWTVTGSAGMAGAYQRWILAGLCASLVGDVCLAIPDPRAFLAGLVAFLLGHVLYVLAFLTHPWWGAPVALGGAVVALAGVLILAWLWPRLGPMKLPVVAYVLVISTMMTCAWSILVGGSLGPVAGPVVFAGAFLFYVSDITVARHRFVREQFENRLIGWPLYFAGQFLIAASTGLTS